VKDKMQRCPSCGKMVYFSAGKKKVQCKCGCWCYREVIE